MHSAARNAAVLVGLVSALAALPAAARDPFSLDLTVDDARGSRGFTTLEGAYTALSTSGLQQIVPSYTEVSAATAALDLRGVPAVASFAAGSPVLRVQVPGAGIDETFIGATREESRRLFERWLQGRGDSAVDRLLRTAVRTTPTDPVAGNPNSALTNLAVSDFSRAVDASLGASGGGAHRARFGSFSAAGLGSNSFSLPLDYSLRLSEADTLQFDVPLTYVDTAGAASYSGNVGVLYRRQMTANWALQPSVRFGGAGSLDLGAGSGIWSTGLTSTVGLQVAEGWRLTIANAVTYVATLPISVGRYTVDYNVANTVFRNGLVLTRNLGIEVWRYQLTASLFAIDTRFTGSPVFIRNYQEFGAYVSAGREQRRGLGVTLMTGDRGLFGVTVSGGVRF
jgi:hypothetical protein